MAHLAQPDHIEIDATPARRLVKRAIRDLEEANRELAHLETRCRELEKQLASEYGIEVKHV
jgi:predicted  nucleic acid-binding Zn-ribbon protein